MLTENAHKNVLVTIIKIIQSNKQTFNQKYITPLYVPTIHLDWLKRSFTLFFFFTFERTEKYAEKLAFGTAPSFNHRMVWYTLTEISSVSPEDYIVVNGLELG